MSTSLTEKLTNVLRQRVVSGELPPGTVVVEPRLAEEFSVSKTPVRESLRQLSSEGFLQVLPKKGYLVRSVTLDDLYETLDMRLLLEPYAAGAAAEKADAPVVAELRAHLAEQERLAVDSPIESMHFAQRFHELLAHSSGNSRVKAALERCFADTARAHYVLPGMQRYMSASQEVQEHRRILKAIEAGSPDVARQAMAEHLKSIRETMLDQFRGSGAIWA